MSNELDLGTVRELSSEIHKLNLAVMEVKTLIGQFGPMLTQQINGLTDLQNRVTRVEDKSNYMEVHVTDTRHNLEAKLALLEKRIDEEKRDSAENQKLAIERQDRQIASNRWLIGMVVTLVLAVTTVGGFIIRYIQIRPN